MESVGNTGSKVGFNDDLECFGVPHNELRLVRFPVVNCRHEVAIVLIFGGIGAISLLVVKLATGVSFSKAHLFDNFILLLVKFDEASEVHIFDLDFTLR